jgi:putative hydrolase of the HAD superfamily
MTDSSISARPPGSLDWSSIQLVVFDVDGTLYRQSTLRLLMACDMLLHALSTRTWSHVKVLSRYRRLREEMGDGETDNFDAPLVARTAAATGASPEAVRAIVAEWMEKRPLRHLERCRYDGIVALFEGLRTAGKRIAILSDYPVIEKLASLGLSADHVACAADAGVGILKPHPRGLQWLIREAGVEPWQTVLIGDRVERDGFAAQRAGAHALIRSDKVRVGWTTFRRFDDPLFAPVLKP